LTEIENIYKPPYLYLKTEAIDAVYLSFCFATRNPEFVDLGIIGAAGSTKK
jgi:hypothetical protein